LGVLLRLLGGMGNILTYRLGGFNFRVKCHRKTGFIFHHTISWRKWI
jgi:hypothetical protein